MGSILCQFGCQNIKVGTSTPLAFDHIHIEVEALLLIDPQQTELTYEERYSPISGGQCVRKRTFPCASTFKTGVEKYIYTYSLSKKLCFIINVTCNLVTARNISHMSGKYNFFQLTKVEISFGFLYLVKCLNIQSASLS